MSDLFSDVLILILVILPLALVVRLLTRCLMASYAIQTLIIDSPFP